MTNSSSNCTIPQHVPLFLVIATLSCISGLICVIGNTIVVVTIYKTKSLQTVSYFLISSLAIADGMVGALLNPLVVTKQIYRYSHRQLDFPDELKTFYDFLWIQGLLVSTFSLTSISIDRFLAITKSIYYRSLMTVQRCWKMITFAWVVPTMTALVRIVLPVFRSEDDLKWLWLTTIIMASVFPLSITGFCYYKIFKSAREQAKKLELENIRNTKAAKTMAIVLSVFVVTYLPSLVIACMNAFESMDNCHMKRTIAVGWSVACLIAYSSSAINPWIYALRLTAIRRATRKVFGLKRRTRRYR